MPLYLYERKEIMEGWISIYRKIQEHWLWTKKRRFSEFEAWMSLLFKANHKATQVMIYKTVVNLKAGSFITSELKLAEQWGWSRETVRKFLKLLEKEKMLLVEHTTKYTIVSIENWDLYQNPTQQNRQQIRQQSSTDNNDNKIYLFLFNKYKAKIENQKFGERVKILSQLTSEIDYQVLSQEEQDDLFNRLLNS